LEQNETDPGGAGSFFPTFAAAGRTDHQNKTVIYRYFVSLRRRSTAYPDSRCETLGAEWVVYAKPPFAWQQHNAGLLKEKPL
jgi:hypothetical protein